MISSGRFLDENSFWILRFLSNPWHCLTVRPNPGSEPLKYLVRFNYIQLLLILIIEFDRLFDWIDVAEQWLNYY